MAEINPKQAVHDICHAISQEGYDLQALLYNVFCSPDDPRFEFANLPEDLYCIIVFQTDKEMKLGKVFKTGSWCIEPS